MRILVTGGTGFFGKQIALRLLTEGHQVAVLGRNEAVGAAAVAQGLRFIRADMTDRAAVRAAVRGQDQVVHCAALAAPFGRYRDFYQANVVGTEHLLEAALAEKLGRLVDISTPSLYFNYASRVAIRESDPLPKRQYTHYGATKLLASQAVAAAGAAGLPWISIRPRALIGAGDQTVLPRLLKATRGDVFTLIGDGSSLVDLTCIENAVEAVRLCVHAPASALGRTYNITNDEPMSVRAMVEMVFKALKRPVRCRSVPFAAAFAAAAGMEAWYGAFRPTREPPLTRFAVGLMAFSQTLDISDARNILGYQPQLCLADGAARFAAWWQLQSQWARV